MLLFGYLLIYSYLCTRFYALIPVVFKDMSNGDMFLSRSTAKTNDTVEFEGETYPVVKIEISSTSHPFYTGKSKLVDTAGRVDKFMSRYGKAAKK